MLLQIKNDLENKSGYHYTVFGPNELDEEKKLIDQITKLYSDPSNQTNVGSGNIMKDQIIADFKIIQSIAERTPFPRVIDHIKKKYMEIMQVVIDFVATQKHLHLLRNIQHQILHHLNIFFLLKWI